MGVVFVFECTAVSSSFRVGVLVLTVSGLWCDDTENALLPGGGARRAPLPTTNFCFFGL